MKKDITKFRISVFRSNRIISAQVIDDGKGITLFSISTSTISDKINPIKKAFAAGELLAKKAKEKKISKVYFDRNGYKYHGRVKSLAEGIRAGGLQF